MLKQLKALFLNSAIAAVLFSSNSALANTFLEEGFESGTIANYTAETDGSGSFKIVSGSAREGHNFLRITKNKAG